MCTLCALNKQQNPGLAPCEARLSGSKLQPTPDLAAHGVRVQALLDAAEEHHSLLSLQSLPSSPDQGPTRLLHYVCVHPGRAQYIMPSSAAEAPFPLPMQVC